MAGSASFGNPFVHPAQFSPWGVSPLGYAGLGVNPYAFQQYTQNQPLVSAQLSSCRNSSSNHLLLGRVPELAAFRPRRHGESVLNPSGRSQAT